MIFFYIYWFVGCFFLYLILAGDQGLLENVVERCGVVIGMIALLIFTITYPVAFFPFLYKGDNDE